MLLCERCLCIINSLLKTLLCNLDGRDVLSADELISLLNSNPFDSTRSQTSQEAERSWKRDKVSDGILQSKLSSYLTWSL